MTTKSKCWLIVSIYTLIIYSFLPIAYPTWNYLIKTLGKGNLLIIINSIFVLFGILFLRYLIKKKIKSITTYLSWLIIALVYAYMIKILPHPAERVHYLMYGLLAILVYRAFSLDIKKEKNLYIWTTIVVFFLGWIDEGIQWLLPDRTYEFRDVMTNFSSSVLGQAIIGFVINTPGEEKQKE